MADLAMELILLQGIAFKSTFCHGARENPDRCPILRGLTEMRPAAAPSMCWVGAAQTGRGCRREDTERDSPLLLEAGRAEVGTPEHSIGLAKDL